MGVDTEVPASYRLRNRWALRRSACRAVALVVLGLLAGCASTPNDAPASAAVEPLNLSGDWEVDHGRSDNIQRRLNSILRRWQQEMERRARAAERGAAYAGPSLGAGRDLVDLASMAEIITAPELLKINQTESEVWIKRENSFALVCQTDRPPPVVTQTPFGEERCGWDGTQMTFSISLPEGLAIQHRISRSELGDSLAIQTAVVSPTVSEPFVVTKVYNRFDPSRAGYRCTETLTRGKVCTTERTDP